jgi:hypothetical protein
MAIIFANLGSILLCAALAAILTLVTVRLIKGRRTGCAGCRGACSGCLMQGECHERKKK